MENGRRYGFSWFVCSLAGLFFLYQYALRISPSLMEHQVRVAFALNASSFGNLTAMYYYIYAPMQLLVGAVLDRYGTRYVLSLALFLCALGIFLYGMGQNFLWIAFGRILIGLGASFSFVGALKVSVSYLPKRSFSLIAGFTYAMGMLGGIIGDLVLVHLVQVYGWKQACLVLAIFGVALMLFIFLFVRDQKNPIDNELPLTKEGFSKHFYEAIKTPQLWLNGLVGCLLFVPISGFAEVWQVPYLSEIANFSRIDAAMAAASVFAGCAVGAPLMCYLAERLPQRRLLLTGGCVLSTVLLAFVIYVPGLRKETMLTLFFAYGFCTSVAAMVFPISRELVSRHTLGTAFSLTNALMMCSGLSIWVVGLLLDWVSREPVIAGVHHYSIYDFQLAFLLFPSALVLATFLTLFLKDV